MSGHHWALRIKGLPLRSHWSRNEVQRHAAMGERWETERTFSGNVFLRDREVRSTRWSTLNPIHKYPHGCHLKDSIVCRVTPCETIIGKTEPVTAVAGPVPRRYLGRTASLKHPDVQ